MILIKINYIWSGRNRWLCIALSPAAPVTPASSSLFATGAEAAALVASAPPKMV
jgi:hypothetical protein